MRPVIKGQTIITEGKKQIINANIKRDNELIFKGEFQKLMYEEAIEKSRNF